MTKKIDDAKKKAKNLQQQENKTPELAAAKKAFQQYFKEHDLDPTKDYTKDPVHGKKITKLLSKLNRERDKVAAMYPESDKGAMEHIEHQAKHKAYNERKVDKLQKYLKEKEATEAKERKVPTKYDYPLIDGREMNSAEKKKYRMEQRKAKSAGAPKENTSSAKPKKDKKEDPKAEPKAEPSKKDKKDKKKKKVHKEED